QLAIGRERADDPGTGRSVPTEIALGVVGDHGFAIRAERDGYRLLDDPDERMIRIDTAVEDADAHALAGRAAPRPLPRHLARPFDRTSDLRAGAGGEAPGGPQLPWWLLWLVRVRLGHGWILRTT